MIQGAQHIRTASLGDLDQVAHLIADAHRAAGEDCPHYNADAVLVRLNRTWASGGQIFVVDVEGVFQACGAIAPAGFARFTWTLCHGATRPEMQGRGLGHQLVMARLDHARAHDAGVVLVSSRNEARWSRYGFERGFTNSVTGAHLMFLNLDGRA